MTFICPSPNHSYWVSYTKHPPNKSDFVEHINDIFTETGVLEKQEFCLLSYININLPLYEKEIFSNKVMDQMAKTCHL